MQGASPVARFSFLLLLVLVTSSPLTPRHTADEFSVSLSFVPSAQLHQSPRRAARSIFISVAGCTSSTQILIGPCRSHRNIFAVGGRVALSAPSIEFRHTALSASSDSDRSSIGNSGNVPDIDEAYRIAMEEDEEWFTTFVSEILGGEEISSLPEIKVDKDSGKLDISQDPIDAGARVEDAYADELSGEKENKDEEGAQFNASTSLDVFAEEEVVDEKLTDDSTKGIASMDAEAIEDSDSQTDQQRPKGRMSQSGAAYEDVDKSSNAVISENENKFSKIEESNEEKTYFETDAMGDDLTEDDLELNSKPLRFKQAARKDDYISAEPKGSETKLDDEDKDNTELSYFMKYVDAYDRVQIIPVEEMIKLGYSLSEVRTMQADPLDIILEDRIYRPKSGVPKRWMIRPDEEAEIKILWKEEVLKKSNSEKREGAERTPPHPRWQTDRGYDQDADIARQSQRGDASSDIPPKRDGKRHPRDAYFSDEASGYARGRRPPAARERKPRRRNIDSDRRSDWAASPPRSRRKANAPPQPNTNTGIWMDLPTFREFLKREAQLRLSVLGPGWAKAVKGESEWRLDLYEKWLDLLNGGFDDDETPDSYVQSRRRSQGPARRRGPTPRQRREEWARKRAVARENFVREGQQGARPSPSDSVSRSKGVSRRGLQDEPRSNKRDFIEDADEINNNEIAMSKPRGEAGGTGSRRRSSRNRDSFGAIEEGIWEELDLSRGGIDADVSTDNGQPNDSRRREKENNSWEPRQITRDSDFELMDEDEENGMRSDVISRRKIRRAAPRKERRVQKANSPQSYSDQDEIF